MSQSNKTQQSSSPKNPPFWKASLIKALRGTIGVLENTAIKLETERSSGSEKEPGFLQKLQQLWNRILGKIRIFLPAQFSAKLTDTALTGIIAFVVVMVFLITSNFSGNKPSQIATVDSDTKVNPVVYTTKSESIASEEITVSLPDEETTINPEVETPAVIEQKTDSSQQITVSLPDEETTTNPEVEIPAVIEQKTDSSQQITVSLPDEEIPYPEATAPEEELETKQKPIQLTPEEALIAAIQNQIAEISIISEGSNSEPSTFSGMIESIKANFFNSNITIKISNDWYNLEKTQQDKLATKILQRSQELDFTHLEITDIKGKLIARSPVVGTEIVIFKRSNDV
ncbi:MAG: hypothetical protein AAF915_19325 [Cyanobacteria bacterium P01_D01_bin.50]